MPVLREPKAVIIYAAPAKNSSLAVTFLSPRHGAVSVLARGHRRHLRKGYEGGCDIGCIGEVCFIPFPSGRTGILTEWMETYRPFRVPESLPKFLMLNASCELLRIAARMEPESSRFHFVAERFVTRLDGLPPRPPEKLLPPFFGFLLEFLTVAGFGLTFDECAVCGETVGDKVVIVPRLGGVLHEDCLPPDAKGDAIRITRGSLGALRFLARAGVDVAYGRLQLSPQQRNAAARVLYRAACDHLETIPASLAALARRFQPRIPLLQSRKRR